MSFYTDMFDKSWKKAFEEWWEYHYIRSLYGYNAEQMEELVEYKPGPPFVELAKTRAFNQIPIPDDVDVITNRDPGDEDDGRNLGSA